MNSWGYLSGLLRAEKIHALNHNHFTSFCESPSMDTLTKSLEDTVYGSLFQGRQIKEFTEIFDQYSREKFQYISELAPSPILLQIYALKTDLNNLKLCYKAKLSQQNINWENLSEDGTIAPEHMYTIVDQELWNELPSIIRETMVSLDEKARNSLRFVDFLLDRAFYQYRIFLLQEATNQDSLYGVLVDFYKKEIDCENIKNVLRAKNMNLERAHIEHIIIPGANISVDTFADCAYISVEEIADLMKDTAYGQVLGAGIAQWTTNGSCTLLEKQIDEYLLECSTQFAYQSAGPAVIEEALRSLQIEIKNLKLIIIGKMNNMSADEIKERVRHVS